MKMHTGIIQPSFEVSLSGSINIKGSAVMNENAKAIMNPSQVPALA